MMMMMMMMMMIIIIIIINAVILIVVVLLCASHQSRFSSLEHLQAFEEIVRAIKTQKVATPIQAQRKKKGGKCTLL